MNAPIVRRLLKPALLGGLVLIGVALYRSGLLELIHPDRLPQLQQQLQALGALAPLVYIAAWIAACLLFLPGLPLGILGGLMFGPFYGTLYASLGSTLGASAAFVLARYTLRARVARWISRTPKLTQIDRGVERQGWRMLMLTRMVPLFPFNMQNYVYGLTAIPLSQYVLVSWLCMLPATTAVCLMSGALAEGRGELGRTLGYLGLGAALFVLLSFLPRYLLRRSAHADDASHNENSRNLPCIND